MYRDYLVLSLLLFTANSGYPCPIPDVTGIVERPKLLPITTDLFLDGTQHVIYILEGTKIG